MPNNLTKLAAALRGLPGGLIRGIRGLPGLPRRLSSGLIDLMFSFSSLVVVVFKRLRHNMGLSVSAILGVVAVLSIVVAVPIFSYSISSQVLQEQLIEKAVNNRRRVFSLHMYFLNRSAASPLDIAKARQVNQYITETTPRLLDMEVERIIMEAQTTAILWFPEVIRPGQIREESWISMSFVTQEILPDNVELAEGSWPVWPLPADPNLIQVAVLEDTADQYFLNIGDRFNNGPLQVEISAIWRPKLLDSSIWYDTPRSAYANSFWVPEAVFESALPRYLQRPVFYISWYVIMDETNLAFNRALQYAQGMIRMNGELTRLLPGLTTDYSPMEALQAYLDRAQRLTNLFYAIGGPMVVLALLFIGLTATIAIQQYEQETATMRGRGTSWWQIVSLNLIESLVLIAIAIPLALGLGWLAANLMSKTLSFLQFVPRENLSLTLQGVNLTWIGLAAGFVVLARFVPTLGISRTSIIRIKQEQSRSITKPFWQRFYLDFFLLVPGLYAYLALSGAAQPARFILEAYEQNLGSDEPFRDPLLFVAPSLFAMAVCLIALRFMPFLFRLISSVIDRVRGVWAYLAMQQIARRPQDHSSALMLIMMSLSLSIYSASSAKTLDKWMHDSIYYQYGADLVIHEYVVEGGGESFGAGGATSGTTTVSELDLSLGSYLSLEDHLKLPGVEGATRVGKYTGTYSYGVGEEACVFMGIDRLEFPSVGFYREDFTGQSLGAFMNILGADLNIILVPKTLAEEKGFQVGDRLLISASILDQSYEREMVIGGFYDYFPTVYPSNRPTLIVNLDSLFDNPDSVLGYDIWLNLEDELDTKLLLYQISSMIGIDKAVVRVPGNAIEEFQETMAEPERVGLFGVLNVGFIATGLMPGIGFVLYSYASLRRRFIQLGILQAIGLSVNQLVGYLVLEQFLLMGLAIFFGASIGLLSSMMFLPFLQVGSQPGAVIPPFDVLIGWAESGWLSLGFGMVLFLTIIGTVAYLVRIKVFQAVKMGEAL